MKNNNNKNKEKIKTIRKRGESLDREKLEQLWKLRLQFMDLKERVSPEEDFRKFSYYCRKCQFVYEFTHDSRLVGFFV
ncbi:MAG: hypothetical protein GY754_00245, partial [bacterium]|nr:hypothetical protein [bacterium]